MGTKSKENRSQRITSLQQLKAGLDKHAQTLATVVIDGATFKQADVDTALTELVTTAQQVVTTKAAWQAAVTADKAKEEAQKPFVSGLKAAVHLAFGQQVDALADFGLDPRKTPAPRTPAEKAASAAKALATRAARHTMGTKQKAAIKGDVSKPTPGGGGTPPPATPPGTGTPKS
jgi:hypothetical protein